MSSTKERAQEIQAKLPDKFPSFVKRMLRSHVTLGFWLGLPKRFCDLHLPMEDVTLVLVNEKEDEEYKAKYIAGKTGLSGGWRSFSIAHKLLEGDVLVFQLVQPCKFKIYIVRANGLTDLDGISLQAIDARPISQIHSNEIGKEMKIHRDKGKKLLEYHQEKCHESGTDPSAEQFGNESDDSGCDEMLEGVRFSESVIDFKDMKSIEDFKIIVDGLVIDSEVPKHIRAKYYELCCSQKALLHQHLLEGLNCKLVAGIISDTVKISEAIRSSKLTTSLDTFITWDTKLSAFEKMGMNVGFIRARLDRLLSLTVGWKEGLVAKRLELATARNAVESLKAKFLQVKEVAKNLDSEIEGLEAHKGRAVEVMFSQEACVPW